MKIFSVITKIMGYVSAASLVLMMVAVVANVFMRKIFNIPIKGVPELVAFGMIITIFLAQGWTASEDKQVKVDLIYKHYQQLIIQS